MQTTIKWLDGATFVGESESGHSVVMDGPPENGGRNIGIRPMEMLLIGLGGCTSFDVISILKKSKQSITNCQTQITATRSENVPKVFTNIHVHFIVEGQDLNEATVKRAVNLSAEKYCSASIMLQKGGVEITHDFIITQPFEGKSA